MKITIWTILRVQLSGFLVHSKCSAIGNVKFKGWVDGWVGIRELAYIVVKAKMSDISATYF